MSTDQKNSEEEVDLGSLFVIIGKGFSKFFNFIGSIFRGIFEFIIQIFLFFKKHAIIILVSSVVFGLVGFMLDYGKETIYESKMLVRPNFKSTKQLYSNINYYNDLVSQKEHNLLKLTFNINESEAASLRGFSIEPIINDNDIVNKYNDLILSVDTLAIKDYKFKVYKETFTNFDYEIHEIKIKSIENKIFSKLDSTILTSISKNEFFKKFKELEDSNLNRSSKLYEYNLQEIDSLRKVYMLAIIEDSKKDSQGTSIDMGGSQQKNKELELFSISKDLNFNLSLINIEKANKSEIINVISSFQKVGNKVGGFKNSKIFLLFAFGFFGSVFFLLLKDFNKFLENYKK